MARKTNQELIQELVSEASRQLQLTLSSEDVRVATRQLRTAQSLTAMVERMTLANPMGSNVDLETIVAFTRGKLWSEARAHLAQLSR